MHLTNMDIEKELDQLKLVLPNISTPGGNYQSVVVRNQIAFIAIQFPIRNEAFLFKGKLGKDLSTEQGYEAMQLCALNVLAQIMAKVGLERITGLNHLDIYYQSVEGWDDAPFVANGASDLFVNVLKEKGNHTRAIIGVADLPRNFSVGLVSTFSLNPI
jgi:enamine deaminase RidA (YjgF/YER057c/UK114 family)